MKSQKELLMKEDKCGLFWCIIHSEAPTLVTLFVWAYSRKINHSCGTW